MAKKKKKNETVEVAPVQTTSQDMAEVLIKYMEENPIFVYTDLIRVARESPLFSNIVDSQLNIFINNVINIFMASNLLEVDNNGVYSKTFKHIDVKLN